MKDFEQYLTQIEDPKQRARMAELLDWVAEKFPGLGRRIAWNQPMFTDHGTFIIGFSASKHHLAAAPEQAAIERFSEDIRRAGYAHTKQLIRFPWARPIDYALLERIIGVNIAEKADATTFWRKPGA